MTYIIAEDLAINRVCCVLDVSVFIRNTAAVYQL